ncbi:hypothetical protein [Bifidobacterium callimiconis]|uniref:Tetratricopeptide repeat protein n=1 Tax=Bifidobacterium callimiconis TaxID=2306973 RepID=A0A430FED7_9BIFI|nr:hypothetical protein [Bifidobacterium callimiconis]MBT1177244.1 hypothetical protein [Bifidobacterium callimiconis]RSX51206.1 hypothetical protein D2E23_1051 [Bifidobacterium callimiconis]
MTDSFSGADMLLKELAGSEFPVSDDIIERLRGIYDHLVGISPDDPDFERYLREDVIEHEMFDRADAIDISDSVLDVSARHKNDPALLPAFFIAFEWFHRCEFDAERRQRYWERFVPLLNVCLGGFSLYQYALSMFYLYGGDERRAEAAARKALDIAPDHIGFLNTYTEQILDRVERELISTGRQMPEDNDEESLNELLTMFDKRPREGWHPIFHVSYGRILACLGRYSEAQSEYSRAVDLENSRYNTWIESGGNTIKASTYVTEMNEIFDARNTCNMLSNMRSLSSVIDDAQSAQRDRARELDDKMDELGRRFDNERIDMLEFIGFFAGIISFVIASIQLGDGLEFPTRALMVLLLMGSLLVAFGSFSALLESGRAVDPREPKRGHLFGIRAGLVTVIALGLVVIVVALLLYLVIR